MGNLVSRKSGKTQVTKKVKFEDQVKSYVSSELYQYRLSFDFFLAPKQSVGADPEALEKMLRDLRYTGLWRPFIYLSMKYALEDQYGIDAPQPTIGNLRIKITPSEAKCGPHQGTLTWCSQPVQSEILYRQTRMIESNSADNYFTHPEVSVFVYPRASVNLGPAKRRLSPVYEKPQLEVE
jgi:hypothetical protein